MQSMIGKPQARNISKVFPTSRNVIWIEVLLLGFVGILAVVLRAKLRIPLNMPGHHGLEVMALLLLARSNSKISFAASISTFFAALFILFPFMGFKDPFLPLIYIVMGFGIDILYKFYYKVKESVFFFAIMGGLAYTMIPLCRIAIYSLTGYPYSSLIKGGFILPVLSHFIFGVAGAVLAASLIYTTKKVLIKK